MTDASPPCHTDAVSYWIMQVSKAHRTKAAAVLAESGLYPGQEQILMSLWEQDGQTLTQLASSLCVQPATVTKMVDRMERGGLLERHPDPQDGRVRRIQLTDTARALRAETFQAWAQLETATVTHLTPNEQRTLCNLLAKVLEGLTTDETALMPETEK